MKDNSTGTARDFVVVLQWLHLKWHLSEKSGNGVSAFCVLKYVETESAILALCAFRGRFGKI